MSYTITNLTSCGYAGTDIMIFVEYRSDNGEEFVEVVVTDDYSPEFEIVNVFKKRDLPEYINVIYQHCKPRCSIERDADGVFCVIGTHIGRMFDRRITLMKRDTNPIGEVKETINDDVEINAISPEQEDTYRFLLAKMIEYKISP